MSFRAGDGDNVVGRCRQPFHKSCLSRSLNGSLAVGMGMETGPTRRAGEAQTNRGAHRPIVATTTTAHGAAQLRECSLIKGGRQGGLGPTDPLNG